MKNRLFSIYVEGFPECFVEAPSHSKAKSITAYSLVDSNYAYSFWDAIRMIRSCRLSSEFRYSPHVIEHLIHK